ncbi:MAG: hypothetical protein J2P23_12435 [Microlunatus sp.]|nr:hypothetical protein [Microlunatus sp.]
MTLAEICENVRLLSPEHGWDQADATVRMLHVTAEVGEVADAVITFQAASTDQLDAARNALGHEIFDVIWNLCALANATGIDIEEAARAKMAINDARAWPGDPVAGQPRG